MSVDDNDDVVLGNDSDKAWFRMRVLTSVSNVSNVSSFALHSAPAYFEEFEEISEKIITGPIEIEKDYFSAKMIVNGRMTSSEE